MLPRLKGGFGYDSYGEVLTVRLQAFRNFYDLDVIDALHSHSCYPPAIPKIISCLRHSMYECYMRKSVAYEVIYHGRLHDAGIHFCVVHTSNNR